MKYYSETLRKAFDSEKECLTAEKDYNEKVKAEKAKTEAFNNARKARAKAVEDAYKTMVEAQKNYTELVNKFVEDYGSWHMTISSPLDEFVETFFRLF